MGSKIGLILSFIFIALFTAFGIDLLTLQYQLSSLDSIATNVSYYIAKKGFIDDDFINQIESNYNVRFSCLTNCNPAFGDMLTYQLEKDYKPMIISADEITLKVVRTSMVGYYG
ncbi:MAG: hypothetical protein ACI31G_00250 [Bacilli bacterium]